MKLPHLFNFNRDDVFFFLFGGGEGGQRGRLHHRRLCSDTEPQIAANHAGETQDRSEEPLRRRCVLCFVFFEFFAVMSAK